MEYIKNTLDFRVELPTVVTLGKFDGLHRGHEKLMHELARCKEQFQALSVAFTFDIPPSNRTAEVSSKVLTTNEEKEYIFGTTGIDYLIECPFTEEVMRMEPEEFIAWIAQVLHMKCVVVGTDFHFGHRRAGDYHTLMEYERVYGYRTVVVDKIKEGDRDISSTYVREEIAAGNLKYANWLLGYEYFIKSNVVHGKQLGRTIGIPTINMVLPVEKLLPPNGVYITKVRINHKTYAGVTNVGCKPTVSDNNQIGVETYIIDFQGNLYGESIVVSFAEFLRKEEKFASLEDLKMQMRKDICAVEKYYKNVT